MIKLTATNHPCNLPQYWKRTDKLETRASKSLSDNAPKGSQEQSALVAFEVSNLTLPQEVAAARPSESPKKSENHKSGTVLLQEGLSSSSLDTVHSEGKITVSGLASDPGVPLVVTQPSLKGKGSPQELQGELSPADVTLAQSDHTSSPSAEELWTLAIFCGALLLFVSLIVLKALKDGRCASLLKSYKNMKSKISLDKARNHKQIRDRHHMILNTTIIPHSLKNKIRPIIASWRPFANKEKNQTLTSTTVQVRKKSSLFLKCPPSQLTTMGRFSSPWIQFLRFKKSDKRTVTILNHSDSAAHYSKNYHNQSSFVRKPMEPFNLNSNDNNSSLMSPLTKVARPGRERIDKPHTMNYSFSDFLAPSPTKTSQEPAFIDNLETQSVELKSIRTDQIKIEY
ncbi:hypothetical protein O181_082142 [Austropuccinia psidii MF-1]|uniref:Uncharacterized protein n=1 Tax=Austropuccinia psidii MF-1 TaxID=1389203 RepID=A0A9Q3IIY5_9BASI|nr:hypothetical protein [Austropuccinia psidii MF-1]